MKAILPFLLLFVVGLFKSDYVFAEINLTKQNPDPAYANSGQIIFTFESGTGDFTGSKYTFGAWRPENTSENLNDAVILHENVTPQSQNSLEAVIPIRQTPFVKTEGTWTYRLWLGDRFNINRARSNIVNEGKFIVYPPGGPGSSGLPAIKVDTTIFRAESAVNVHIINAQPDQGYIIWFNNEQRVLFSGKPSAADIKGEDKAASAFIENIGPASDSLKTLCMTQGEVILPVTALLSCDHRITGIKITAGTLPSPLPGPVQSNQVGIPSSGSPPPIPSVCPEDTCDTALGPISTKPELFIKSIFGILLSLSGGAAVILIIISGYRLMVSQGNPEKIQAAREQLTSAVVGLLFIIFSLSILQIIGVDILKIPGLER